MTEQLVRISPSLKNHLKECRGEFTFSLRRHQAAQDEAARKKYLRRIAKYINQGQKLGFTVEQITQGQNYPAAEVSQYAEDPSISTDPGLSEEKGVRAVEETVDTSNVLRHGDGAGIVYAYGYVCLPDRLKVGSTEVDAVQRIAAQIKTSTPDKPCLVLEIRTDQCRALERAVHATLEVRGRKISGGGTEWFRVSREEVIEICKFISQS
jgi:T5orf172 domain